MATTHLKKTIEVKGNDKRESLGLIHVYTGDGRGKTSIGLGTALRAAGSNLKTHIIQFMKSGETGELTSLNQIRNITIEQYGIDAVKEREKQEKLFEFGADTKDTGATKFIFRSDEEERDAAVLGMEHAIHCLRSGKYDMIVLDEVNCILEKGLYSMEDFKKFLDERGITEIICTGRDAPQELMDMADYVSIIENRKHPWQKGIIARKGIDY